MEDPAGMSTVTEKIAAGWDLPNCRIRQILCRMRLWICDYPGASRMALEGMREILELANRGTAKELFQVRIGGLDAASRSERNRFLGRGEAWVVVPTGSREAVAHLVSVAFAEELALHRAKGHRVAAVCAGNFALAAAGLFRGRSATTHWALEDEFRRRFPDVELAMERILLDHGELVSAGGYTAFVDLSLWFVARAGGRGLALRVARTLQVDPVRDSQSPWLGTRPLPALSDSVLDALVRKVAADPARDWKVEGMARSAGMGTRTLERRFREATGTSPRRWIQERRLERARELLEGGASLSQTCDGVGWSDVASFARLFRERTGMTPARYREWVRSGG